MWIESHQELRTHPKTLKLAHLLGVEDTQAVGCLMFLWWWVLDYADSGDLSKFDALDLAIAGGWKGDPDTFVESLARAGFLDPLEDGGFAVHDWEEYTGRLLERRRQNAERAKRFRELNKSAPPPKAKPKAEPGEAKPRETRIPEDFAPDERMLAWAEQKHYPEWFIERQTEQFKFYFGSRTVKRLNWGLGWMKWLDKAATEDYGGEVPTTPPAGRLTRNANGSRPSGNAVAMAQLRAMAEGKGE